MARKDNMRAELEDATEEIKQEADEKLAQTQEQMTKVLDDVRGAIDEKVEVARAEIQQRPFLYTAVALGAGIAIGYIVHNMTNGHSNNGHSQHSRRD